MKNRGFTLLELIVTIALVAILMTIAIPNLRTFLQNNRISGQTNELVAALNLVRSEAVRHNREAWLCPTTNFTTCNGTDWDGAWLAMATLSTGGTEVVRVWESESAHASLAIQAPDETRVRFGSNGMLVSAVNPADESCPNALCFDLEITGAGCRAGDDLGFRRVVIPATGGTRVEKRDCPS